MPIDYAGKFNQKLAILELIQDAKDKLGGFNYKVEDNKVMKVRELWLGSPVFHTSFLYWACSLDETLLNCDVICSLFTDGGAANRVRLVH